MKKIAVLSIVAGGIFALSSFTTKKENSTVVRPQLWKALCADGSVGGYFTCDCSQTRANEIAHVMCN
ncbi:hypothetical protein KB553_01680 [Chryseobacterium rhizoplanae]|uniref:hypothetical protein n=1 Tax=Chryseobacterium rhizoplanae TaxID=1609531 RepID=UPI001CE367D6|nr:hypothetical protein [Chryseobacterium rhizoplanae]UCA60249.1 hypothetical protein KB553_01680 [Chryseobacterium rhizoplanae]